MTDLAQLIGRLEAAQTEVQARYLAGDVAKAVGEVPDWATKQSERQPYLFTDGAAGLRAREWLAPHYTTSIDAIVALIERRLPGWVREAQVDADGASVRIAKDWWPHWDDSPAGTFSGWAKREPLAACIAFLRALQAQQETSEDE